MLCCSRKTVNLPGLVLDLPGHSWAFLPQSGLFLGLCHSLPGTGCCLWFCTGINNFGVIKAATLEKMNSFFMISFQSPYGISGQWGLEILRVLKNLSCFFLHVPGLQGLLRPCLCLPFLPLLREKNGRENRETWFFSWCAWSAWLPCFYGFWFVGYICPSLLSFIHM